MLLKVKRRQYDAALRQALLRLEIEVNLSGHGFYNQFYIHDFIAMSTTANTGYRQKRTLGLYRVGWLVATAYNFCANLT